MRLWFWSLVTAAAVAVDSRSPEAALYWSRCMTDGLQAAGVQFLRLDQHAAAFPWSFVVMAGMCVPPWRAGTQWPRAIGLRLLTMLVAMPASCLLAWLLARQVPMDWQAGFYAATMLVSSALFMRVALRAGWPSSTWQPVVRQKA